jgi:hypothetical protein
VPVKERRRLSPLVPLALLEALRDRDRPTEVLEDENFAESLPRRLGLSDVVFSQIRRFEDAVRHGEAVPADEALDLLRLVLRRPDAAIILRAAGRSIARRHFEQRRRPAAGRMFGRGLPRPAVYLAVRRSLRTLVNRLFGRGAVRFFGRPLAARIDHPFTASASTDGTACVLVSAAIEELVFLYTRQRVSVLHARCEGRGDDACEWVVASDRERRTAS